MRRTRKAYEDRIRRIEAAFPHPLVRIMERIIEEDGEGRILRVTIREGGTKGRHTLQVIGPKELAAGVPIPGSSPQDGRNWLTIRVVNTRPEAVKPNLDVRDQEPSAGTGPEMGEAELLDEIERLKARKAALIAAKGKKKNATR